ncbi:MAG: serine hydrolase [Hellea sp.]|nr:serine hydrolase [Hellea sp.]
MTIRKVFKYALLLSIIIILSFVAFNWKNILRLQTVSTLFDADKIVYNFSNMKEAFLHNQLESSPKTYAFDEEIEPLPNNIKINGEKFNLENILAELDTTALVIIKDGKLIHESYYRGTQRNDLRISWSVAKSFMSGLYGKALESGDIDSIDDKVVKYVPSLEGSAYGGATIRNVLNMASGITFNEDYMDPKSDINDMGRLLGLGGSMDQYAVNLKSKDIEAGERWKYVSIDTHIAAMVLREATGKNLHDLFNETYSNFLGFDIAPYYLTDGKNVAFALGGLNLTTRDYAKFGQLFLQNGIFNDKQVIPSSWVSQSTNHSAPTIGDRGVGYGYQWWIPMPQEGSNKGDFTASGVYGQYVYVNPSKGIVIAKNAADREFTQKQYGYNHSMNVNIDIFRSLADYYSANEE